MTTTQTSLFHRAEEFLVQFYGETGLSGSARRLEEVQEQIRQSGTYQLTEQELTFGARLAWRNSNRCIGRLSWKSLKVRDRRHLSAPEKVFADLLEHLDFATNGGKVRSTISVYSTGSEGNSTLRIWNKQLIRYAGYRLPDGSILGDPDSLEFTQYCQSLGWTSSLTPFDVLPLVIQQGGEEPEWFNVPEDKVLRVPISHPEYGWMEKLGIQWYAIPVISDMRLEMGGISFHCAPFNGYYMLSEIAVRNLADDQRYNLLPVISEKMNLDTRHSKSLWKDKALLALQEAVLFSYQERGVSLIDHHTASEQFMDFCKLEQSKGRSVQADWSWIVPPTAGSTMRVFHQEWNNAVISPNFYYQRSSSGSSFPESQARVGECPFSRSKRQEKTLAVGQRRITEAHEAHLRPGFGQGVRNVGEA